MNRWHMLETFTVVVCIAAAYISNNLLEKHMTGSSGLLWFESVCHADAGRGTADCDAVLASPYGYFPPKRHPDARGVHFPVAFLGLVYYTTLAVWIFGVGRLSIRRRWMHIIPLGMVVCGIGASGYYSYIMFTQLDQWCPWCLVTHIINLFVTASVVLLFPYGDPDRADRAADEGPTATVTAATARPPHPSARLVATTLLAMIVMVFGLTQMLGRQNYARSARSARSSFNRAVQLLQRVQRSGPTLRTFWEEGETVTVPVRPKDASRGPANPDKPYWDIVVFSDFECPSCRKFALFLDQRVHPLFAGQLRVIFKHYPLDSSCNERTRHRLHPHACEMARIAEAGQIVGGEDTFWHLHDYLFRMREVIRAGEMTPEAAAEAVEIDAAELVAAMATDRVAGRIEQDVADAAEVGVGATPSVYVNGKFVDSLATLQIDFWDELADAYWAQRGVPRPEDTTLSHLRPTPDTLVPVSGQ